MKTILRLELEFSSDLHHGTGDGIAGILDRAFCRDSEGVPYLMASAIKGKLRFGALRFLRSTEDPGLACRPEDGQPCGGSSCLFCQIFGSPRVTGQAIFEDAYPRDRAWFREVAARSGTMLWSGPAQMRATAAMSRAWQRAEPRHLFTTETMPAHLEFSASIRGNLTERQVRILRQSAAILNHFGGDSARGLGFCTYRIEEAGR